MKTSYGKLLCLCLIVILAAPLSGNWTWQNPLPQGNSLTFIDSNPSGNRIITGGRASTLMHTNDSGNTWQNASLPNLSPNDLILEGMFTDDQTACAITFNGKYLKSTDGGSSWIVQYEFPGLHLYAIDMIDNQIGFIMSTNSSQMTTIQKTTNGGESWTPLNLPSTMNNYAFFDIDFYDANNGIAVGAPGVVIQTTNGGNTWSQRLQNFNYQLWSGECLGPNEWFVCGDDLETEGDGVLLRTDNAGHQWQTVPVPNLMFPKKVVFTNNQTGFLLCDMGAIYKSVDAGINWDIVEVAHQTVFSGITRYNRTGYLVCGMGGVLLRSTDSGSTFEEISTNANGHSFCAIKFFDNAKGLAANDGGKIYKTVNGGNSWNEVGNTPVTGIGGINQIIWPEETVIYIIGIDYADGSRIFWKSLDSGDTWMNVPTSEQYLDAVCFLDANHGFGCFGTYIKQTSDGGLTWSAVYHDDGPIALAITSIHFFDSQHGIAGGLGAKVYITSNGGTSWTKRDLPIVADIAESMDRVQWINQNTIVAGYGSILYLSTDAGASWQIIHNSHEYAFKDFYFIDANNGYALLSREIDEINVGVVAKTSNGGISWQDMNCLSDNYFRSIAVFDQGLLWVAGESMNILRYSIPTESIDPIVSQPTLESSAYPNPFGENTTICFNLPKEAKGQLIIYNVKGQKVRTLADNTLSKGKHEIVWDGQDDRGNICKNGMYFCKITAGRFTGLQKLTLIK